MGQVGLSYIEISVQVQEVQRRSLDQQPWAGRAESRVGRESTLRGNQPVSLVFPNSLLVIPPSGHGFIHQEGTQMKISSGSRNLRYSQIPFSVVPFLYSVQVPEFQCSCDICLTSSKKLSVKLRGGVEITDQFEFPKEACNSPGSRK